jgi:D-threo-aldose 1-dehydrogenase
MHASDLRTLPRGGLALSSLGLGCAQLGGLYQAMSDGESCAIVDAAWNLGIRYFDTAPYYGYTLSERRLGAALRGRNRSSYAISTKVGRLMQPDANVQPGENGWAQPLPFRPHFDYSYDAIKRSHEDSLQRLGLDRVDILYVHDIGRVTHGPLHQHYWEQLTQGGGFRALTQLRAKAAWAPSALASTNGKSLWTRWRWPISIVRCSPDATHCSSRPRGSRCLTAAPSAASAS